VGEGKGVRSDESSRDDGSPTKRKTNRVLHKERVRILKLQKGVILTGEKSKKGVTD